MANSSLRRSKRLASSSATPNQGFIFSFFRLSVRAACDIGFFKGAALCWKRWPTPLSATPNDLLRPLQHRIKEYSTSCMRNSGPPERVADMSSGMGQGRRPAGDKYGPTHGYCPNFAWALPIVFQICCRAARMAFYVSDIDADISISKA
nr:hypothetical protein Iba_scaffold19679CG0170 [Ipomoea batatas]